MNQNYSLCRAIDDRQITDLAAQIAEKFRPEKIILFGSYAYGIPHDLLVVMEFAGRKLAKSIEIWKSTRPDFATDLIVRTPNEMIWRYEQYDPLVRNAIDLGKVLYERCR
jgi:hypothetical protein